MSEKLLRLKFMQERRIQYSAEMSEFSRGYHAALKQVVKDCDLLLSPVTEECHDREGSCFDRPVAGFADN